MARWRGSTGDERGSALPLVALALCGVLVMTMLLTGLTVRIVERADAQAAADAAALAGAAAGRAAAAELAAANGATLVGFEAHGNVVVVEVRSDLGVRASASAERSIVAPPDD